MLHFVMIHGHQVIMIHGHRVFFTIWRFTNSGHGWSIAQLRKATVILSDDL